MYSYVEIAEPPCYSWSLVLMTWHQFTFVSPLNKHALYYKTSLGDNYHWIRKSKSEKNKLNKNLILHVPTLILEVETLMTKSLILYYFLDIEMIKMKKNHNIQTPRQMINSKCSSWLKYHLVLWFIYQPQTWEIGRGVM